MVVVSILASVYPAGDTEDLQHRKVHQEEQC